MPQQTTWYCGHCGHGPMSNVHDMHCMNCHRPKDTSSREQTYYVRSDRRFDMGSSTSSLLGGISSHGSTLDYPISGTYGQPAPAGVSYNYPGTSGIMSRGKNSSSISHSSQFNKLPKGGYSPVTYGNRVWFCCRCDSGPMLVDNNAKCSTWNCQHTRCLHCHVE